MRVPPKEMAAQLYNEVGEQVLKSTGKINHSLTVAMSLKIAETAKNEWDHFTYRDIGNSDYWTHVVLQLNEMA